MSAALRTTQGAGNLRPAATFVALVAAAVLGGVVGFAVSRTATSQQAATQVSHPIVIREPKLGTYPVAGSKSVAAGIPYVGTGTAAQKIRDASVAGAKALTGRGAASGLEHANGGPTVTGVPYQGTGTAATIIRGTTVSGTDATNVLIVRGMSATSGIPYVGTGTAAQKIRDASAAAKATTGRGAASGLEYANGGAASSAAAGPVVGDMSGAAYLAMTGSSAKSGNGEDMSSAAYQAMLDTDNASAKAGNGEVGASDSAGVQSWHPGK
jgi:hypothetical protein